MDRGDTTSDGWMASPTDHRSLPLDISAGYLVRDNDGAYGARLHVPAEGHGHPRPADLAWIAVAKWLCGTPDRHRASRVSGPNAGDYSTTMPEPQEEYILVRIFAVADYYTE